MSQNGDDPSEVGSPAVRSPVKPRLSGALRMYSRPLVSAPIPPQRLTDSIPMGIFLSAQRKNGSILDAGRN